MYNRRPVDDTYLTWPHIRSSRSCSGWSSSAVVSGRTEAVERLRADGALVSLVEVGAVWVGAGGAGVAVRGGRLQRAVAAGATRLRSVGQVAWNNDAGIGTTPVTHRPHVRLMF